MRGQRTGHAQEQVPGCERAPDVDGCTQCRSGSPCVVDPRERCTACRSTCPTTRKKRRDECEAKEIEHVEEEVQGGGARKDANEVQSVAGVNKPSH